LTDAENRYTASVAAEADGVVALSDAQARLNTAKANGDNVEARQVEVTDREDDLTALTTTRDTM